MVHCLVYQMGSSSTWPLALAPCVGDHCLCLAHPMSFRWSEKENNYGTGWIWASVKTIQNPGTLLFSLISSLWMFIPHLNGTDLFWAKIHQEWNPPPSSDPNAEIQCVFTWFPVKSRFFHARTTTVIWISPPNQPSASPSFTQAFGLRLPVERMQCPWEPWRLRALVSGP